MKQLKKKLFIAGGMFLLLVLVGAGGLGTASAADRFNGKDDQKVINYCKNALGGGASQLEIGACHQGYIYGYDGQDRSKCNDSYSKPEAVQACRKQGYNGGLNNSAHVSSPRQGGGGHGGGVAAGSADTCGDNPSIGISIAIGCRGHGNPIADMAFAIIRVLSAGVGVVVVGSIAVGGIQYSASRGDPQATAMAINRIRSSLFALIIYIFGFALLNYIIPGAVLQ